MFSLVVTVHIFVCIILIMIVLLQTGKGAEIGAVLGGSGSETLFGSTGAATFLSKLTTVIAIVFMVTSLILAYMSGHRRNESIMLETKAPAVEQKATPEKAVQTETTPPVENESRSQEQPAAQADIQNDNQDASAETATSESTDATTVVPADNETDTSAP